MNLHPVLGAVIALLLAAPHAEAGVDVRGAFQKDGWIVNATATAPGGGTGYFALAANATTLDSGEAKKAYYATGSAFDLGWLIGYLGSKDAEKMAVTYVSQLPAQLVAPKLAEDAQRSRHWRKVYDALVYLLGDLLVAGANKSFEELLGAGGYFPDNLVAEMRGVVAGAKAADPSTGVTFDRVVTLNYGIDFLLTHAYAGTLKGWLGSRVDAAVAAGAIGRGEDEAAVREYLASPGGVVRRFAYCDAFGAKGSATASSTSIFARDFQMPCGTVYQDATSQFVLVPEDGRLPVYAASAPGFVGGVTLMNSAGFAVGVDVLRAAAVDPAAPGMNSLLLIRHVASYAKTTEEAVEVMAATHRGCSWLYPMCDASGDCRIVEAGKSDNATAQDPLSYVNDPEIADLLPDRAFLAANPPGTQYRNGLYARAAGYEYPEAYLSFNEKLFAHARYPYNASAFGPGGFVFPTFEANNAAAKQLQANWFCPQRESNPDVVVCSNSAVVPHMRIAEMSIFADFIERTAHAIQWRYDTLLSLVLSKSGSIDLDTAQWIISFLSPDRTPGYWPPTKKGEPMSALVEGNVSACDLKSLVCRTLGGYWADKWVQISLANYLSSA